MKLTIVPPRGILQIDDARIVYRNFSGAPTRFNPRGGTRDFAVVIPTTEMAEILKKEGWNVKSKPPRDDQEEPFHTLSVRVAFNDRGPNVYLQSGTTQSVLDEESVGCLDRISIARVDLDIRPYDWEVNGKTGRTAYLQAIRVTQDFDRFADIYAEEEFPAEVPF